MNQKIVYKEKGFIVGGNFYSLDELRDFYIDKNKSRLYHWIDQTSQAF